MDSEIKVEFVMTEHKSEFTVKTLKSEEKPTSVTSDYAEDVASSFNSIATSNTIRVFDVSVTTQDVKLNDPTEPVMTFTLDYLNSCLKNLLNNLDHLKVDFYDLETLFLRNKEAANSIDLCRKRLTSAISLIEKFSNHKDSLSHFNSLCHTLDCTYRTLSIIKEQLLKLDLKTAKIIVQIEGIIDYANSHIRNVVLALDESKVKSENGKDDCTIVCEIEYSKSENKIEPKVIDVFSSDSECEVLNDTIQLTKEVVVKLERLKDIKTSPSPTKESTSLSNAEISGTDDTISQDTDSSRSNSSDPSYTPSDSIANDSSNLLSTDSSLEKSPKIKKRLSTSFKKRSNLRIYSDSSDGSETAVRSQPIILPKEKKLIKQKSSNHGIESSSSNESECSVCYPPSSLSKKKKTPRRRPRFSTSKKPKLQIDTSDESDTEHRQKTPAELVRPSPNFEISSQISFNDHCDVDNSIKVINDQKLLENPHSFSSDNIRLSSRSENSEPTDQLLEQCDSNNDDSNESELEMNSGSNDQFRRPKTMYSAKIKRKHKIKLIGIRDLLRNLV